MPIKGDQIVQVSITPATDDRTDNNSRQIQQMVTSSRLQPYDDNKRISSGIDQIAAQLCLQPKCMVVAPAKFRRSERGL